MVLALFRHNIKKIKSLTDKKFELMLRVSLHRKIAISALTSIIGLPLPICDNITTYYSVVWEGPSRPAYRKLQ